MVSYYLFAILHKVHIDNNKLASLKQNFCAKRSRKLFDKGMRQETPNSSEILYVAPLCHTANIYAFFKNVIYLHFT